MGENRLQAAKVRILAADRRKERQRPRAPTYRYRSGVNGHARLRLQSVDFDLLRLAPDDRLLDVGCGTGRHLVEAARRDCCVVGLDSERDDLVLAKGYLYCLWREGGLKARVNLVAAQGERLPFEEGSFDRIVCTEVLEHVPDDRGLIAEFVRLLRPGGTMAVSVPDRVTETVLWRLTALHHVAFKEHVRIYDRRRLQRLLEGVGFKVFASRRCHSLESLRWSVAWMGGGETDFSRRFSDVWDDFVEARVSRGSRVLSAMEGLGNLVAPKSLVMYARKARKGGDNA